MKTIIIDNKYYLPAKVIMLPTEVVSGIWKRKEQLFYSQYSSPIDGAIPQYLYLVCDLPIEEGDCYLSTSLIPYKAGKVLPRQADCKKVIAATDRGLSADIRKPLGIFMELPDFNQSFIKEFVERKGKDVDVLVEVDLLFKGEDGIWYNKKNRNNSAYHYANEKLIDIVLNSDNTINLIFK